MGLDEILPRESRCCVWTSYLHWASLNWIISKFVTVAWKGYVLVYFLHYFFTKFTSNSYNFPKAWELTKYHDPGEHLVFPRYEAC